MNDSSLKDRIQNTDYRVRKFIDKYDNLYDWEKIWKEKIIYPSPNVQPLTQPTVKPSQTDYSKHIFTIHNQLANSEKRLKKVEDDIKQIKESLDMILTLIMVNKRSFGIGEVEDNNNIE